VGPPPPPPHLVALQGLPPPPPRDRVVFCEPDFRCDLTASRYLGLQHLIQMKGMSDTDVTRDEIILRVASEDPAAIGALQPPPPSPPPACGIFNAEIQFTSARARCISGPKPSST